MLVCRAKFGYFLVKLLQQHSDDWYFDKMIVKYIFYSKKNKIYI